MAPIVEREAGSRSSKVLMPRSAEDHLRVCPSFHDCTPRPSADPRPSTRGLASGATGFGARPPTSESSEEVRHVWRAPIWITSATSRDGLDVAAGFHQLGHEAAGPGPASRALFEVLERHFAETPGKRVRARWRRALKAPSPQQHRHTFGPRPRVRSRASALTASSTVHGPADEAESKPSPMRRLRGTSITVGVRRPAPRETKLVRLQESGSTCSTPGETPRGAASRAAPARRSRPINGGLAARRQRARRSLPPRGRRERRRRSARAVACPLITMRSSGAPVTATLSV